MVTVTPNRLCPIRLPLMKPNTAGIAARIMKYPVYRPLTVAGSAAITGHSLFGDSRIDLTRSRSEEHTSELQSLMRISYAVFCLKKKKQEIARQQSQYKNQYRRTIN